MKDFHSAAEMIDHYKQVRERLNGPVPEPRIRPKTVEPPPPAPPPPEPPPPMPSLPVRGRRNVDTPTSYRQMVTERRRSLHDAVFIVVEAVTHVTAADIIGTSRKKAFVRARSMLCWVVSMIDGDMSARQIGIWIGRRDHTTVWWSLDRMRCAREVDGDLVQLLEDLEYQVRRIMAETEDVH